MTDKEVVKVILKDFCKTCAYIGLSDGFDIEKFSVVFRRIFKTPNEVGDPSVLLDFAIILALSNAPYLQYDSKTSTFIEATLNLIEENFKGFRTIE